ncbi:hypothetical protein SAMN04488066_10532 [Halorubrum aquaticum]|uniref:DUF8215 domain-containing protein n=1 Tax=Halorubrum aquaticum TaxID=387340 RepID=A0A1I3ACA3_9EURY|nr:hypothetical protein [Halorubrum aquaticum]SFH47339.1 hypothetical protein SAMN04488066_10532 [Halorubrum aquaticum]
MSDESRESDEPRGYDERHYTDTKEGASYWTERLFFAGIELTVLASPALVLGLVFQSAYPDALPTAGIGAVVLGSPALALFRTRAVDAGEWPRLGEVKSVPLRVAYFSALYLLATLGVAATTTAVSGPLPLAFLGGGVVQVLGLAAFPTAYRAVHGEPVRRRSRRR